MCIIDIANSTSSLSKVAELITDKREGGGCISKVLGTVSR